MKRKLISLALAALMVLGLFTGCDKVGQIAGSVADAARQELEAQVKAVLEEYKVDLIEMKTTAGKLNDNGESVQIFCAILVRSDNEAVPQSCAEALGKLFTEASVTVQTDSSIENDLLVHKELSYQYTGFGSGGTYYTIYVYSAIDPSALLPTGETE